MAKLILFSGKGGCGKSTTSAATAYHWATQGYKTLLVSSDPAHSTEDVVGKPVGHEPTPIQKNFWAMNIHADIKAKSFQETLGEQLENNFNMIPGFEPELLTDWAAFPGIDEVFALEEIMHLVQGVEFDIVVFDTAPTGHTLKALSAPDAFNKFLLRIIRMKRRIEGIKSIFVKKSDTDALMKLLQESAEKIERFKHLLRNEDFVSINLVGIPTEAGYQETERTIHYLKSQGFKIHNIAANNIIPSFDEATWEASATNKAVALLNMERQYQQPYVAKYSTLTDKEGINLVGVSKLPFQPMGAKLLDFGRFLKGLDFTPEKSVEVEEDTTSIKMRLRFPHSGKVKLNDASYKIDYHIYDIPLPVECRMLKSRKQKTPTGATYSYKVVE